jgi:peroxiredoxin
MGSLQRLSRRAEGKKFAVIGISTDDDPDAAKALLQKAKVTFHNFIDTQLSMENMLGADRLPLMLLVDAHGKVLAKFYGARDWDSPGEVAPVNRTVG